MRGCGEGMWRGDVAKRLKYMLAYVRRIGDDAATLRMQVQHALGAMARRHPEGIPYEALTRVVGGALAWWDGNHEELDAKHNIQIEPMIPVVDIQKLFIERLRAWTTFMAPWGWRRQTRWKQRDWVKLIFMTMQRNTAGSR